MRTFQLPSRDETAARRPPRLHAPLWLGLLLALVPGCVGGGGSDPEPGVLVSVLPQRWIAERVVGGGTRVTVLIPPGASPATHEPTLEQLRQASSARLWLAVGHPAFPWEQGWLDDLAASSPDLRVIDGSADCRRIADDYHVWLDPSCVASMAERLAAALPAIFPELGGAGRRGASEVRREAEAVDAYVRARLEPFRGRAFVTFHPAWGYWAEAYGIDQIAVVEHGTGETGPGQLAGLIERAQAAGARCVLVQPQFSRSGARVVADELGARVVEVDPLAADWPAALRRAADAFAECFSEAAA